jgi:translation initiation factor 1 (eIF-1/SUI1)
MLKMLRKDVACGCPIKDKSQGKSCLTGPLTKTSVDDLGDHLHSCTQHAGAMMGAHEHDGRT